MPTLAALKKLRKKNLVTAYEFFVNPAEDSTEMVAVEAGTHISKLSDYVLAQLHPDHFTAAPEDD